MSKGREGPEWFAPKRYGYGAGFPIAWQGWAVLASYIGAMIANGLAFGDRPAAFYAVTAPLTLLLLFVAAKTTRGGWRWRWGAKDEDRR